MPPPSPLPGSPSCPLLVTLLNFIWLFDYWDYSFLFLNLHKVYVCVELRQAPQRHRMRKDEKERVWEKERQRERGRGRVTAAPGKCFLIGSNM